MAKHIVIIGGGPAGIEAALAAASHNPSVTLLNEGPLGGRAVWQTLLPAKFWLNAADAFPGGEGLRIAEIRRQFQAAAENWQRQHAAALDRAGVEVITGWGVFESPHRLAVLDPTRIPDPGGIFAGSGSPVLEQALQQAATAHLDFDAAIIATGAVPFIPPTLQPDGRRILAPNLIWRLESLPRSLVMVGAGGPATEYVDLFSRLGVRVTWLTGPVGVLSAFPPAAGLWMMEEMSRRGVKVVPGIMARDIRSGTEGVSVRTADGREYPGELAFVAIGHRPDLARLNPQAAGLRLGSSGGLEVDGFGRTPVSHIYLVGDAALPMAVNAGMARGRVAGLHAAGQSVTPFSLESTVLAVYTRPEVAVVGRMSDPFEPFYTTQIPYDAALRAHLGTEWESSSAGFLELVYDSGQRVVGGMAIGPQAADVLAPLAIAIRMKALLSDLAEVRPAHPTYSELVFLAARAALESRTTPLRW